MTADRLMSQLPQETIRRSLRKLREKPLVRRSNDIPTRLNAYRCPFCTYITQDNRRAQLHVYKHMAERVGLSVGGTKVVTLDRGGNVISID